MEQPVTVAITRVKHLISNADESQRHIIFLDRRGEIDMVSAMAEHKDDWVQLREEARAQSGGPYFEILSIAGDGRIFTSSDSEEYRSESIDDGVLRAEIQHADVERDHFYAERAEVFGPSAYPANA